MVNAKDAGIISIDRAVEVNPYVNDVSVELERLQYRTSE